MPPGYRSSLYQSERPMAPATRNSITSSMVAMPPMPIRGIFNRLGHLINAPQRNGLDGGAAQPAQNVAQDRPATRQSTAMPRHVLISDRPSAPPASAARAISVMSVTLGVSLARIGSEHPAAHARDHFLAHAADWCRNRPRR